MTTAIRFIFYRVKVSQRKLRARPLLRHFNSMRDNDLLRKITIKLLNKTHEKEPKKR